MPRGGARPGAGRKPTKPKEAKAPNVDMAGFKTDPSWPFGQQLPEPPAAASAPAPKPDLSGLTPLDYLLSVMRNEDEDKARRMQAASLAAPFVHAKKGESGKKEEKAAAAKQVAGRFTPGPPPRLAAAGGKKV